MPLGPKHKKFDRYLAERGVLFPNASYEKVHEFIDRGVKKYGPNHREKDDYHNADEHAFRDWLNGKSNIIKQDMATDWLRAGYGHYCLDDAERRSPKNISDDKLFDSAYRSMCQKGWDRAKFYFSKYSIYKYVR